MFFVKYLDQKQGEARVVDQQQLVRQRLEAFLQKRPSPEDLQALGILGWQQRFALAAEVVNELLKSRLRAQEEALERPGCGDRHYDQQLLQLLSGPASQARLEELRARSVEQRKELQVAQERWKEASADCLKKSCSPVVPQLIGRLNEAGRLLAEHQEMKAGPLAEISREICSFQKLLVKRRALQDIVAMAERTDAAREAVFSFGRCPEVDVKGLLELCTRLPARSRAVGLKRLRFLVDPLRRLVTQELLDVLKACWPKDEAQNAQVPHAQVLSLCKQLRDAQVVDRELRRLEGNEGPVEELWPCAALAAPLLARFRHHFCRPDSELCRMDKPEWAFRSLA
ncbi:unnamed protein product [Durusdinium trenchii]|uniref:Uncharacterized protein n=1 Tax=Durusdinium trenchii TaxID=1381693 RepID=A0ABP0PBL8_9DINO